MTERKLPDAATLSEHGKQPDVSPSEYNAFIKQIELRVVWLEGASIENRHGPASPKEAKMTLRQEADWHQVADGFVVSHDFNVRFKAGQQTLARIEVTFGLYFMSTEPMSDRLFAVFRERNIPVNSWPYLREFLASATGRMGWIPFTLPSLKSGMRSPQARPSRREAAKPRTEATDPTHGKTPPDRPN